MGVKWSACSPYTPTIRVQIPLQHRFISVNLLRKERKLTKKTGVGPFINETGASKLTINLDSFHPGSATSCSSSPRPWTTPTRAAQRTPAAPTCPTAEDPSSEIAIVVSII